MDHSKINSITELRKICKKVGYSVNDNYDVRDIKKGLIRHLRQRGGSETDEVDKLLKYLQPATQCSKNPYHLLPPQIESCYKCADKPSINKEKTQTFRSFDLIKNKKTG